MSGLARLHPHLQHAIVHDLGWRSLRPVQTLTLEAVLDGCNCVVLAPTAGGKTEAAMFPLLSRILAETLAPVSVLYVCPIRALLNNQEERLRAYARMVGLDVFKWHGDVNDSRKQTFRRSPSHVLMTTPESLEVMMISAKTDARVLFAGLSAVVIDEVHAFAGDDRGAHLVSLLERLVELCGRDVQRIGLSATVGNPQVIGQWLQGSSQRPFRLVDPPRPQAQRDLLVRMCEDLEEAAQGIRNIARGKKSLIFVESRARAEKVAHALADGSVDVFIHHSSVSRADRALAEEQFARGQNTAIVCTSTMELGIDVGDLDQVIQLDAPTSVASFLQRLGRTGRREGSRANCTFFCLNPESLLQSLALLRLAESGWVEDVRPGAHAMHVLAHQVMALILQEGGLSRHRIWPWVEAAYPFSSVRPDRVQELIDTMLERDILYEADGLLSLGGRGEKLYGRKNFFELYAVFTVPPMLRVQHGREDVGYVQALFVSMQDQKPLCFRLGGRAWEAVKTDWGKGVLHVRPAAQGRVPSWLGLPGVLSRPLCQAMLEILVSDGGVRGCELAADAATALDSLRAGYAGVLEAGTTSLECAGYGVQWHTFAGGGVNRLLSAGMQALTGAQWIAGNLSVRSKDATPESAVCAIESLARQDWEQIAASAASGMARGSLSKFQPCLPEEAESLLLAERLLDLPGTLQFLAGLRLKVVHSLAAAGGGLRVTDTGIGSGLSFPIPPLAVTSGKEAEPRGEIRWAATSAALRELALDLDEVEVIGLDVETTLELGTPCLVQIATGRTTWLVDTLSVSDLELLRPRLAAPRPVKVLHNARFDRRQLAFLGIQLDGVYDTMEASRRLHGPDAVGGHSLAMVCERELGIRLDKSAQTSNWARRPLSAEQIRYAALDAEIVLDLHAKLSPCAPNS